MAQGTTEGNYKEHYTRGEAQRLQRAGTSPTKAFRKTAHHRLASLGTFRGKIRREAGPGMASQDELEALRTRNRLLSTFRRAVRRVELSACCERLARAEPCLTHVCVCVVVCVRVCVCACVCVCA